MLRNEPSERSELSPTRSRQFRPRKAPLPLPPGLLFPSLPLGPRSQVRREQVCEQTSCPRLGAAKSSWAEERKSSQQSCSRGRQSTPKSPELNVTHPACLCYLQLSLQCCHLGKNPAEKKILLSEQNWALSPQRECGISRARCRRALRDAKPCEGCKGMQSHQRDARHWEDAQGAAGL